MMYLYCITDARTSDLNGLDLNELHFIDYKTFTIVAAEPKNYEPASPQFIMAHYKINSLILNNGFTVLPFAYNTVIPLHEVHTFTVDNQEKIMSNLEKFKGKVEMGVKILALVENYQNDVLINRLGDTPGHQYLFNRLGKYAPVDSGHQIAQRLLSDIDKYMGSIHKGCKMKIYNRNAVLINFAFLINKDSKDEFIKVINRLKALYPDCKFMLSGAWPAYNFISFIEKN